MIYIGIDPGKKGGYASINGDHVEAYPWDDIFFIQHLHGLLATHDSVVACVEKVNAMPGQGVSSMFTFGKSAGYIEGVLSAMGIPYQLIPPRVWKKTYGLDSSKQKSIDVCRRLFPDLNLLATERSRVPSDGVAESALLALYAKRHF